LSAATCAGWTALANLYTPDGAFERDVVLDRCPELLVFDHAFIRQAPQRTLAVESQMHSLSGTKHRLVVQIAAMVWSSKPCKWHGFCAINC
jgi:hypothetical protein